MKSVAVVYKSDRAASTGSLTPYIDFKYSTFALCAKDTAKVFKKDITLDLTLLDPYDYVICVGAETAKFIGKVNGGVMSSQGSLINDKYIPLISPGMLAFKPETKPGFEIAISRIIDIVEGVEETKGDYVGIQDYAQAIEHVKFL